MQDLFIAYKFAWHRWGASMMKIFEALLEFAFLLTMFGAAWFLLVIFA